MHRWQICFEWRFRSLRSKLLRCKAAHTHPQNEQHLVPGGLTSCRVRVRRYTNPHVEYKLKSPMLPSE